MAESPKNPPSARTALDTTVSIIDWPIQGTTTHSSCTVLNGCTPSNNVTVLILYGPEFHAHISEMAWNVATGVHAAFQSHIKHHPNSPMQGHIISATRVILHFTMSEMRMLSSTTGILMPILVISLVVHLQRPGVYTLALRGLSCHYYVV